MKTQFLLTATASAVAMLGLAPTAQAQTRPDAHQVIIYGGQTLDSIGAHATAWGGGTAADHDGDAFTTAGHAVHIETAGLYQGGTISFDTPVDLGDLKADPTRFIQIIFSADKSVRYPSATMSQAQPTTPIAPGYGPGGPQFGGMPQPYGGFGAGAGQSPHFKYVGKPFQIAQQPYPGLQRTGRGGQPIFNGPPPGFFGPGGPGMGPMGVPTPTLPADDTSYLPPLAVNEIHVIFIFADGSQAEMLRPINLAIGDDTTWLRAGIPLSVIPLSGTGSDAQLKSIRIGSDVPADLNIGEIRELNDTTAITADAGKSETVPAGAEVTVVGTGEGGASALKYEWDFDSPSPFVVQSEGIKATHVFSKPGDYTVTLKVSDVDGIKQPATATVVIHVNDQSALPTGVPGGPPPGYGGPPPGYMPNGQAP